MTQEILWLESRAPFPNLRGGGQSCKPRNQKIGDVNPPGSLFLLSSRWSLEAERRIKVGSRFKGGVPGPWEWSGGEAFPWQGETQL